MDLKFGKLGELEYALGLVFSLDEQPKDTSGIIPCRIVRGEREFAAFYLPPQDVKLERCTNCYIPASMTNALWAEIVLRIRQGADRDAVTFAWRVGKEAFGFDDDPYLPLPIERDGDNYCFEPLFIRENKADGDIEYYSLDVMWNGNEISVFLDRPGQEMPRCLMAR